MAAVTLEEYFPKDYFDEVAVNAISAAAEVDGKRGREEEFSAALPYSNLQGDDKVTKTGICCKAPAHIKIYARKKDT